VSIKLTPKSTARLSWLEASSAVFWWPHVMPPRQHSETSSPDLPSSRFISPVVLPGAGTTEAEATTAQRIGVAATRMLFIQRFRGQVSEVTSLSGCSVMSKFLDSSFAQAPRL
jgi:hypothetical protein